MVLARSRKFQVAFGSVLTTLALSGCDRCESDHPYTPFGITTAVPAPSPPAAEPGDAAPAPDASAPESFHPEPFLAVDGEPGQWKVGGRRIDAPKGLRFTQGLAADMDGDGKLEAMAWLAAAGAEKAAAEPPAAGLWLFPAAGQPRRVAEFPGFVPTGPGCQHDLKLTRTGPQTVTLEVAARCEARLLPRSPVRALLVLAPLRPTPQVVGLRVAQPAEGESLKLHAVTTDRDGDGVDDVSLEVTVQGNGSDRPASALLVWLDRAAGEARDDSEPSTSLARAASVEQVRSKGKNTSLTTHDGVTNLRRLYASICAESGTPRLWTWNNSPLSCGNLQATSDRLAHAESQAALVREDALEALSVLTRADWWIAPISASTREELRKLLVAAMPSQGARLLELDRSPRALLGSPQFSPLSFEPDGALLLQTTARDVARFAPGSHVAEPPAVPNDSEQGGAGAPDEPLPRLAPWTVAVTDEHGTRWSGVVQACDRSELLLLMAEPGDPYGKPWPSELLSARPGACAGRPFESPFTSAPVAWASDGLVALVAGSLLGPGSLGEARKAVPKGSALSQDGRWLVVPTTLGLWVEGPDKDALWKPGGVGSALELHHCVIANGGTHVACLHGDRAVLVEPGNAPRAKDSAEATQG